MRRLTFLLAVLFLIAGNSVAGTLTQGFEDGPGGWHARQVAGNVQCSVVGSPWWIHSGSSVFMAGPSDCEVNCQENSVLALEIVLHRNVQTLT